MTVVLKSRFSRRVILLCSVLCLSATPAFAQSDVDVKGGLFEGRTVSSGFFGNPRAAERQFSDDERWAYQEEADYQEEEYFEEPKVESTPTPLPAAVKQTERYQLQMDDPNNPSVRHAAEIIGRVRSILKTPGQNTGGNLFK